MNDDKCEIEWFDENGRLTPDSNPSIGRVRTKEYDYTGRNGKVLHLGASRWMHICAHHAKRLIETRDGAWKLDHQRDAIWEWETASGAAWR